MKKTLFALFATSLGLASNASLANTIAFDGIELGKTTCQDYMAKHADLRFTFKDGYYFTDASAFNIPATTVQLGCAKPSEPIVLIAVNFNASHADEAYKLFPPALTKKFGKPKKQILPFVGNRLIRWETKDAVIEFAQTHLEAMAGALYYGTKELLTRWNNRQQEEEKKRQSTVENTL